MVGVSEFVRGTLAYLANCATAFLILLVDALRLRPVRGALRCEARHDALAAEVPDSRVMLFISCCLLGLLLTNALSGGLQTFGTIARVAFGDTKPTRAAIVTAAALYFTCEWSIARATSRAVAPGPRGRRDRQVMRFAVAALLIAVAVCEPFAVRLSAALADATGSSPLGASSSAGRALGVLQLAPALLPPAYLAIALGRLRGLGLGAGRQRALRLLPLSLPAAALAAALLLWAIYPAATPLLADLRCTVTPTGPGATLDVDATFANPGDRWWRPNLPLMVSLEGGGRTDPRTGATPAYSGGGPTRGEAHGFGGFDPLLVAPREKATLHRRIALEQTPTSVTTCRLSNSYPTHAKDFFSIFLRGDDDWATSIDWKEVTPAETIEGTAEMAPAEVAPDPTRR